MSKSDDLNAKAEMASRRLTNASETPNDNVTESLSAENARHLCTAKLKAVRSVHEQAGDVDSENEPVLRLLSPAIVKKNVFGKTAPHGQNTTVGFLLGRDSDADQHKKLL